MNEALLLSLYGVCLVLSSFFSGSETALTTLSEAAVFRLKERRHPQAARLERLRERLPQTISTLLIGNNLVNIAAGSIGTVLAIGALGPRWGVVAASSARRTSTVVAVADARHSGPPANSASAAERWRIAHGASSESATSCAPITRVARRAQRQVSCWLQRRVPNLPWSRISATARSDDGRGHVVGSPNQKPSR